MTRVLIREGADYWTSVHINLAVVQKVMMYRSETWVMTTRIGRVLGEFHQWVACNLTGRQPQRGRYGVWVYLLLEDAMEEA